MANQTVTWSLDVANRAGDFANLDSNLAHGNGHDYVASWVNDLSNCVSALVNWDGFVATVKLTWPNGMIMWPAVSVSSPTWTVTGQTVSIMWLLCRQLGQ